MGEQGLREAPPPGPPAASPADEDPSARRLPPHERRGRPPAWPILLAVLVVLLAGLGYAGVRRWQQASSPPAVRTAGLPADVPTTLGDLMQLAPVPGVAAPDFTLVDQHGQTLSLSSLRGRAVVLEFMDSHCTDICPIVSKEFADAFADLGPARSKAAFVAVDVNPFHTSVADVAAFSADQGLGTIPSWHFLTGPVPALEPVWRDYGISVQAPNPEADVVHTSIVYFIDPRGRERFSASPTDRHTAAGAAYLPLAEQRAWGRGIALVAADLSHS